jgi:hypothetical protein
MRQGVTHGVDESSLCAIMGVHEKGIVGYDLTTLV